LKETVERMAPFDATMTEGATRAVLPVIGMRRGTAPRYRTPSKVEGPVFIECG